MSEEKFTIQHWDDFERNGKWSLARRSLGVESFGMNIVTIGRGEKIPEHTEMDRDQEEVFVVLSGTPTMVIDGKEYETKRGTCIRLGPEPKRYIVNTASEDAFILVISAPKTSGYTPLSWA